MNEPAIHATDAHAPMTTGRPSFRLRKPREAEIAAFRARNEKVGLSYAEIGQSADGHPAGYHVDHNTVRLGWGEETWTRACGALRAWHMFPGGWAEIVPVDEPVREGLTLTMIARGYGVWWMSGCRIVYLVDEAGPVRRFGFAYGTLGSHVEQGEERFMVEMLGDGTVWYDLRAFSRPRYWPVRLMKPLARRLQERFVRESLAAMVAATKI